MFARLSTASRYSARSLVRSPVKSLARPLASSSTNRASGILLRSPSRHTHSTSPFIANSHRFPSSTRSLVTISSSLIDGLKKHEIVPEVVEKVTPEGLLIISYGKDQEVMFGNTLKPADAQVIPEVYFTLDVEASMEDSTYTFVLTDPDAPSRTDKKWSEFCHYIVSGLKIQTKGNSPIDDVATGTSIKLDFSTGKTLVEYMGPAPPENTGKHRYVFLLFKEPSTGNQNIKPPIDRPNWGTGTPATGVQDWATKNNLSHPVAINFFYAQNEKQEFNIS